MLKLSLNKPLFNISHPFSCKLFRVRYTPASFFANLRSPSYFEKKIKTELKIFSRIIFLFHQCTVLFSQLSDLASTLNDWTN